MYSTNRLISHRIQNGNGEVKERKYAKWTKNKIRDEKNQK